MGVQSPDPPTLAAERTLLSWERSAFGFLIGSALVLFGQHGPFGPGRTLLALTAALLASLTLLLGYRRSRQIRDSPIVAGHMAMRPARCEVLVIGGATVGFATAIVAALLYSAWRR